MKVTLFILLIFATHFKNMVDLAIADRKYVDQKDISERCKRRVAPSIFLGKQVMDASSHVMQLSRLEVPYSCSFSVRSVTCVCLYMLYDNIIIYLVIFEASLGAGAQSVSVKLDWLSVRSLLFTNIYIFISLLCTGYSVKRI